MMKISIPIITLLFLFCCIQSVFCQNGEKSESAKFPIGCADCGYPIKGIPIYLPRPEYPKTALAVNVSGTVGVLVTINKKGVVIKAEAVTGHPLLQAAAIKAALQAKFKPVMIKGKIVQVSGVINYNFAQTNSVQIEINDQTNNPQLDEDKLRLPIVNGRAKYLPKSDYPQKAKDFCASGKVEVEVFIDESGNVLEAKAISGEELLLDSAVEAAKKAKFSPTPEIPVKMKGIIVYNFVPEKKCIVVGIVNKKALYLPKPYYSSDIKADGFVKVLISIDMEGKVIAAKAILGHVLLRPFAEAAARQTKFNPTLVDGGAIIYIKAALLYNFKSDHTIETDFSDETVNGKAINLPKPPFPSCNCKYSKKNIVIVQVEIDEKGDVVSSRAISGHPILKQASEQAARFSKFSETKISGISVKAKALLTYEFLTDDGSVYVTVTSIKALEQKK